MDQLNSTKDQPKCLTKAEVFEHLKFQLLEMKDLTMSHTLTGSEHQKRLDKLAGLINTLEELENTTNEEKLQHVEQEVLLKSHIEQLRAKAELKEIEHQQAAEDLESFKVKFQELQKATKQRFTEVKNRLVECIKSKERDNQDESKTKLEMLVYRLNYFIQNDSYTSTKRSVERTEVETEQKLIEKLSEKYRKELDELSLSQRERLVFNYIHQSTVQDDLKDVCLEDLLQITGKSNEPNENRQKRRKQLKRIIEGLKGPEEVKKKEEYKKFVRICNCRSAVDLPGYGELFAPEEDDEEDSTENDENVIVISQDSESNSDNDYGEEKSLLDKLGESGQKEKTIEEIIESDTTPENYKKQAVNPVKKEKQVPEKISLRADNVNMKLKVQNEKPYEDQKRSQPNIQREIISQRLKRIKKAQIMLLDNMNHKQMINRSFVTPHAPEVPVSVPLPLKCQPNESPREPAKPIVPQFCSKPQTEGNSKPKDSVATFRKEQKAVLESQSKSAQKLACSPLKNYSYHEENSRPVIVSKNYGDQHNEVNVNISILEGKFGSRLKKQVAAFMPAKYPKHPVKPKDQKPDKMSSRSYSVKYIARGQNNSKQALIRLRGSIEPKIEPKGKLIERNVSPVGIKVAPRIIYRREASKGLKPAERAASQQARVHPVVTRYTAYNYKSGNVSLPVASPGQRFQGKCNNEPANEYASKVKRLEAKRVSGSAIMYGRVNESVQGKHNPSPKYFISQGKYKSGL